MVDTFFCVNDRSERSFETVLGNEQVSTSVETVLNNFRALVERVFPTSLCGVLVFDSVSRVSPPPPAASVTKHTQT